MFCKEVSVCVCVSFVQLRTKLFIAFVMPSVPVECLFNVLLEPCTVRCKIIHSNLVLDVLAIQVLPASRYVLFFSLALYSLDQIVQLQQAIGKEAAAYCHK